MPERQASSHPCTHPLPSSPLGASALPAGLLGQGVQSAQPRQSKGLKEISRKLREGVKPETQRLRHGQV